MSDFATLQELRHYRSWLANMMTACSAAQRSSIVTGTSIPAGEPQALLQADALYPASDIGSDICEACDGFNIYHAAGLLGGALPFRGLMAIPSGGATKLVTVAHGMGSLPDLVMGSPGDDYHHQIGRKLAAAGFAVWAPYFPHAGEVPSICEMTARLARGGLSQSAYVVSAIDAADAVLAHFGQPTPVSRGIYGVSVGAMHLVHASTVLDFDARVLSGYLRYDEMISIDVASAVANGNLMPHGFNPAAAALYAMPHCFPRMSEIPTFFEVGSQDGINTAAYGRDDAFAAAQAEWPGLTSGELVKHVFNGGHEAEGDAALAWLQSILA